MNGTNGKLVCTSQTGESVQYLSLVNTMQLVMTGIQCLLQSRFFPKTLLDALLAWNPEGMHDPVPSSVVTDAAFFPGLWTLQGCSEI
jgi:hypothetical protein